MRLLICTQAVDLDDPVLGFMHRWIAELSKRYETVHVICLKAGRHELPRNVIVHSLGKESGRSRIKYVTRFYRYVFLLRRQYDAVFVHMNPEYVVLGGPVWKFIRKRVFFWRNHYAPSKLADIAALFCTTMFSTSRNSYLMRYGKTMRMPVGIDTDAFAPAATSPDPGSLLFLGRIDPTKRAHVFVRSLDILLGKGLTFTADIVGDPSESNAKYAHDVRNEASVLCLEGKLRMRAGVTNEEACREFASHAVYANLSKQGHFDKTILEAMASGCIVVATNEDVKTILPEALIPRLDDVVSTANALEYALSLSEDRRRELSMTCRAWVEREHSLRLLCDRLAEVVR